MGDGQFGSEDLIRVFQVGKYEDGIAENADWTEGDWDGDQDFTSSDLIIAFQTGLYEKPLAAAAHLPLPVPEPSSLVLVLTGALLCWPLVRRTTGRD